MSKLTLENYSAIEQRFVKLFESRWYTNSGPLSVEAEKSLSSYTRCSHNICMTNDSIASLILLLALTERGEVLVDLASSEVFIKASSWFKQQTRLIGLNGESSTEKTVEVIELLNEEVSALVLDCKSFQEQELNRIVQACHSSETILVLADSSNPKFDFSERDLNAIVQFYTLSQHADLTSLGGALIATNNRLIAAVLKNIRSSYGAGEPVDVPYTGNGRFSEAQALFLLSSLAKRQGEPQCDLA